MHKRWMSGKLTRPISYQSSSVMVMKKERTIEEILRKMENTQRTVEFIDDKRPLDYNK